MAGRGKGEEGEVDGGLIRAFLCRVNWRCGGICERYGMK
jgi:hypothetical protein